MTDFTTHALLSRRLCAALVALVACGTVYAQDPCLPGFEAQRPFGVANNFGMCLFHDFDGDDNLDLTVGLHFYMGRGNGGFARVVRINSPWDVGFDMQIADFNDDGIDDAAIVGFQSREVMFYFGQRNGPDTPFFGAVTRVNVGAFGGGVWHIDKADFNEDGRMDIVAINFFQGRHVLVLNEGGRNFSAGWLHSTSTPGHMLAVGDYDGDGHSDIAVGSGTAVAILRGRGTGAFLAPVRGNLRSGPGHRFRAADIDGDGRSELFAADGARVSVYFGRDFGDETFRFPARATRELPVRGTVRFVELADMNSDGRLDVATLSVGSSTNYEVFVGYEAEDGPNWRDGVSVSTGLSRGAVLAVGDLNNDGAVDIACTTEDSNQARVFLNDASCSANLVGRGDSNGDEAVDLTDAVVILQHLFSGGEIACPAAAEVNGDGALDIADPTYLLNYLFQGGTPLVGDSPTPCE